MQANCEIEIDKDASSDDEENEKRVSVKPPNQFNLEHHLNADDDEQNDVNISTIDLEVSESVKSERIDPVDPSTPKLLMQPEV